MFQAIIFSHRQQNDQKVIKKFILKVKKLTKLNYIRKLCSKKKEAFFFIMLKKCEENSIKHFLDLNLNTFL